MESHTIIVIIVCCVVAPLLAFFAWKFAQGKIHNTPIKTRRKRLRFLLYMFLFFLLAISFIEEKSVLGAITFLKDLFLNSILQFAVFIVVYVYAYFRKDKTPNEKDITEEQVNE